MDETFARTRMILGDDALERLQHSTVAIFGIGGVGSYIAEGLARGGIGHLLLIDHDRVSQSNINRQLIALYSTIGRFKTEVMSERIKDINPLVTVETYPIFYSKETAEQIGFNRVNFIADAIDTVTSKLLLIERAKAENIPIISSMGTGNKLDPSRLELTDLSKTSVCPLARVMRRELKKRGIEHLRVLYSQEPPVTVKYPMENSDRRGTPGSVSFVPSVGGLLIAGEIIKTLAGV